MAILEKEAETIGRSSAQNDLSLGEFWQVLEALFGRDVNYSEVRKACLSSKARWFTLR